jgi:tRNA(Ile)-lysidine synthase
MHWFEHSVVAAWPIDEWRGTHVVVAVSGGADSVALLRAMYALKTTHGGDGKLFVAHLNHSLRGVEADEDVAWLSALCEQLSLQLFLGTADVKSRSSERGDGLEAAARWARYNFLRQTAEGVGARFVATAHTSDDQVETVVHRIVRGTGLAGLGGIRRSRSLSESVTLVRPLLDLSRAQVIEYLSDLGQSYRTDTTNADTAFTRNRIRHALLPSLREQFNSDVDAAVLRLASQASESEQFVRGAATDLRRECVKLEWGRSSGSESHASSPAACVAIECGPLADQPALMVREVCKLAWQDANWTLQSMGHREWQMLAAMVAGEASTQTANLPGNVRARREDGVLRLEIASSP